MIKFNLSSTKATLLAKSAKSAFEEEEEEKSSARNKLNLLPKPIVVGTSVPNEEPNNDEDDELAKVMGFGTFGRPEKEEKQQQKQQQKSAKAQQNIHKQQQQQKAKTARKFDIEELVKEHQNKWNSRSDSVAPGQSSSDDDDVDDVEEEVSKDNKTKVEEKEEEVDDEDEDDLIGPPLPPGFSLDEAEGAKEQDGSSDDEYDAEEDDNRYRVLPISHEIELKHGTKSITALGLDPNGARLVSGSIDYEIKYWDFQGMDSSLQSFRTITPCQSHSIKHLEFNSNGELILVISGSCIIKLVDRDGFVKSESTKGDQYLSDMNNTGGHVAMLNHGTWHPMERNVFATCSNDGTCRLWDSDRSLKKHRQLIKPRSQGGLRVQPNVVCFSSMGDLIALGCNDGSVQMWDMRRPSFVNTTHMLRGAHQTGTDVTSVQFSYNGNMLVSRATDHTVKLWDMRMIRESKLTYTAGRTNLEPLHQKGDLFNRYSNTDCLFSPDDRLVVTGVGCDERANSDESGQIHFYDCNTFDLVQQIDCGKRASVIRTLWHPKLNQIVASSSDGSIRMLYDMERSSRGALLCSFRPKRKHRDIFQMSQPQIITPHALPLFKGERRKSHFVQMLKDRKDPVKSHRPELPMDGAGQGGRLASAGKTFASFIARNLGVRGKIDHAEDPREALLKHAKEASENPYWVTPAYSQTQPNAIFNEPGSSTSDGNEPSGSNVDQQQHHGADEDEDFETDGDDGGPRKRKRHIPV